MNKGERLSIMEKILNTFIEDNHSAIELGTQFQLQNNSRVVIDSTLLDEHLIPVIAEVLDVICMEDIEERKLQITNFFKKNKRLEWPMTSVLNIFDAIGITIYNLMEEQDVLHRFDNKNPLITLQNEIIPLRNLFIDLHVATWEGVLANQKLALDELSAPLLPIFDKICLMPLVGAVDTERAKQIIENLLFGVVKHRSEVVLIDITGVPVVDTMVAHHMMQAIEALSLVGSKSMLVGIRPETAQTLVNLGIRMTAFETESTLQRGFEKALRLVDKKIIEVTSE